MGGYNSFLAWWLGGVGFNNNIVEEVDTVEFYLDLSTSRVFEIALKIDKIKEISLQYSIKKGE